MRKQVHGSGRPLLPVSRLAAITGLAALTAACAQSDRPNLAANDATMAQRQALTVSGVAAYSNPGLAALRRAAMAAPSDYALQARYAGALARAGEPAMAEDIVTAALARSPDHPALTLQLARLRVRNGQPQVALALFDRAAQLQPAAEVEEGRGVALDMLGRHHEAQTAYRAALAQSPNLVSAANNLAMSLMLTGQAAEAVALLEPLSRRRDAPARVANNLAVALSMSGETPRFDTAADPRAVREMASNLRSTVGVAAAQPAPASQFASVEPGRGGASPIFPLDAASRSSFAASASAAPALPAPPAVAPLQPALVERELMPAPLPPRSPSVLPGLDLAQPAPAPVMAAPPIVTALVVPQPPSRAPVSEAVVVAPPPPARAPIAEAVVVVPPAAPAPAIEQAVVLRPTRQSFGSMVITEVEIPDRRARAARTSESVPVQHVAMSTPQPARPDVARAETVVMPAPALQNRAPAPDAAPAPASPAAEPVATAPVGDAPRRQSASVQIGALRSEGAAHAQWQALRLQLPAAFDNRTPEIARADLPQGSFWRLRTSGFATPTDAHDFCQVLRLHGRDCWVPLSN